MYDVDYISLGKAIYKRRKERGLTQEELAERCNLSPGHIGCIERATRKLSVDALVSISYALEVSPNRLLHDTYPEDLFGDFLDTPLKLRQPKTVLRNTLTNWYFADLPDESVIGEPPVTRKQLSRLQFTLLGEDLPPLEYSAM